MRSHARQMAPQRLQRARCPRVPAERRGMLVLWALAKAEPFHRVMIYRPGDPADRGRNIGTDALQHARRVLQAHETHSHVQTRLHHVLQATLAAAAKTLHRWRPARRTLQAQLQTGCAVQREPKVMMWAGLAAWALSPQS